MQSKDIPNKEEFQGSSLLSLVLSVSCALFYDSFVVWLTPFGKSIFLSVVNKNPYVMHICLEFHGS